MGPMHSGVEVKPSMTPYERRYRRFKLRYPVRLTFRTSEGLSAVDTFSRDISIGGLALDCPISIPKHIAVSFVITLRGRALRSIELAGEGEVVRVEPMKSQPEFSVAVCCQNPITQIEPYLPDTAN
jgi:hypothetical protein